MYQTTHPDHVAMFVREQHEQIRRAAGQTRMVRAARARPDKRRWRRR